MSIFGDVWRHSFPKGLRYCKQCLILHSTVATITKRYKHKKYIPRNELEDALATFEPMPGAPITQLPVIRHALLIRFINAIRVSALGRPSWLLTRPVASEHQKIVDWLNADYKNITNKRLERFVDRERFQKEVLDVFHVAALYHRFFRFGVVILLVLMGIVMSELLFAEMLMVYLTYWRQLSDAEVRDYFREVTERHTLSEVPPAYAGRLPPPCVLLARPTPDGEDRTYNVEVCEFVSPDEMRRVVFIPCPQIGPRSFFERVGAIARRSDVLLLEGVPESHISRMAPVLLFAMKSPTFAAFDVHHRFYDILHQNTTEPPKLSPAANSIGTLMYIAQAVVPFTLRYVLWPTLVSGTKAEAKIGWGHLRELLEDNDLVRRHPNEVLTDQHITICVPWSVSQIVNLEASLVKLGYRLQRHYSLEWMREDHLGECASKRFGRAKEATKTEGEGVSIGKG